METPSSLTPGERKAVELFSKAVGGICGSKGWEIRLFGSRARGQGDIESDLDLLVLIENLDEKLKVAIWDAAYKVFDATEILVSPLVLSRSQFERLRQRERLIVQDIESEGVRL